ncbi:MAG: hypothetical protein IPJ04_03480 [Candidatus Eisenbacteria bacterium]|nr:hypothetical protein [Candidatus Eisenbacteria bacterium]
MYVARPLPSRTSAPDSPCSFASLARSKSSSANTYPSTVYAEAPKSGVLRSERTAVWMRVRG